MELFRGRLVAAADVALVARREIGGGFCHLLEAVVQAQQMRSELLGVVETLVFVLLALRLNARVVLVG